MSNPFSFAAVFILVYVSLWFLIAMYKKNNGLVDIAWGLGFVSLSIVFLTSFDTDISKRILLGMVIIWGLRLGIYLWIRNWGKPEDWRYKKWREEWGKYFVIRTIFQVFLLQGFCMWVISLPLMVAVSAETFITPYAQLFFIIGSSLWCIGFLFESISDYQLYQFKKSGENKGKIIQTGLWSRSRHPNYFGEVLLWWGVFIYSIPFGMIYYSIISPILISFLLLKVSGVPMLEAKLKKNPAYQDYIKSTHAFFPKLW